MKLQEIIPLRAFKKHRKYTYMIQDFLTFKCNDPENDHVFVLSLEPCVTESLTFNNVIFVTRLLLC